MTRIVEPANTEESVSASNTVLMDACSEVSNGEVSIDCTPSEAPTSIGDPTIVNVGGVIGVIGFEEGEHSLDGFEQSLRNESFVGLEALPLDSFATATVIENTLMETENAERSKSSSWGLPQTTTTKRKATTSPGEVLKSDDDESLCKVRRISLRKNRKNRIFDSEDSCMKELDRANRAKRKSKLGTTKKRRDSSSSGTTEESSEDVYVSEESSVDPNKTQRSARKVIGTSKIEFGEEPDLCRNGDYRNMTALGTLALDWLRESEEIRRKCGRIQGSLSGKMKIRLQGLMDIVRALTAKAEEKGDPKFWKAKNSELATQLNLSRKLEVKYKKELGVTKAKAKKLEEDLVQAADKERIKKSNSMEEDRGKRKDSGKKSKLFEKYLTSISESARSSSQIDRSKPGSSRQD